jgi:hypothetical protein
MMQKVSDIDGKIRREVDASRVRAATHIANPAATTVEALKDPVEQVRGPEDTDFSRDGSADSSLGKRKMTEREPESPGQHNPLDLEPVTPYTNKKERTYYDDMEQDSPASYPKHVMVPGGQEEEHKRSESKDVQDFSGKMGTGPSLLTPDSLAQRRQSSFDGPSLSVRDAPYHEVYRAPSYHDVDYAHQTFGEPEQTRPAEGEGASARPRRWACDYCSVATFLSYEEACAHEEACARQHAAQEDRHRHMSAYGHPPHGHPQPPPLQEGTGLGALYHASQEVVTPPTPHRSHQLTSSNRWGTRGPPLPVLPHEHGYYRQGYYDQREDAAYYGRHEQYYAPPPPQYAYGYQSHHSQSYSQQQPSHHSTQSTQGDRYEKRMLLAMPNDSDSLSDRQCYVRSEMCEIFAATDKDVAARHSKGAQKLVVGQVGIRCIHCAHLRPRDRAERAVCYPSSISRIYQTVADMQRFHFEQCGQIPKRVSELYKTLKTTRPRGVGSPQAYWVQSAKTMGLADTDNGIGFLDSETAKPQYHGGRSQGVGPTSDMSIEANKSSHS